MAEYMQNYPEIDSGAMLDKLTVARTLREVADTYPVEYDSDRAWKVWGALRPTEELPQLTIMAPTAAELVMKTSVENPKV